MEKSEQHYNDGYVDMRVIPAEIEGCFSAPIIVIANPDGFVEAINVDSNFFSPKDILEAYERALRNFLEGDEYLGNEDEKEAQRLISEFKSYLISTGVEKEDLE